MSTFDPIGERGELFAGHRVAQDLPGAELRLEWQGMPPRLLGRTLPIFLVGLTFTIVPLVVWWIWGVEIVKLAQGNVNVEFLIPFVLVFAVGGFFAFTSISHVFALGRQNGYWKSLAWDAGQHHFQGEFCGTPIIGTRRVIIPLEKIYRVSFSIGPEGKGPVLIGMQMEALGISEEVTASLEVAHVDQRAEAMDLLFRIARIVCLEGYSIEGHTHLYLDVAVLHPPVADEDDEEFDDEELDEEEPEEEEVEPPEEGEEVIEEEDDDDFDYRPKVLPVPDDRSFARYEMNAPPVGFSEPTIEVPEFNPTALANDVTHTKVTWEPGQTVRVHRPPWPLAALGCVCAGGGIVAGVVAVWPCIDVVSKLLPVPVPWWSTFLVVFGVVAGALFIYLLPKLYEREVVFDWGGRQVRVRTGSRTREFPLSSVQGLTLGGVKTSRSIKGAGGRRITVHDYSAQMRMTLADQNELIMETDWEGDLNRAFRKLLPFTVALARELGVPWSVAESGGRRGTVLGRGRTVLLVLMVLVVSSLVGWHAWVRYAADVDAKAAIAEVERGGGKVTFVASRTVFGHELKDVWRVEFPDGINDEKLRELSGPLSRIPRLDLDLGGMPITEGTAYLLGEKRSDHAWRGRFHNLVALDLHGTRISNWGIEDYHRLENIEVVDLSGTVAGDRIASLAMNNKIAVLILNGTQVQDSDMQNLRISPSLKYVGVTNTRVTPQGAQMLRDALPKVIVEEK